MRKGRKEKACVGHVGGACSASGWADFGLGSVVSSSGYFLITRSALRSKASVR